MRNISNYKIIKYLIQILVGVAFLYFVNSLVDFSLDFTGFFDKSDLNYLVIAQVFFLLSFFLKFQRLAIIVDMFENGKNKSSMRKLFSVHTLSSALAMLLPFKLGDVARVLLLSKVNDDNDYSSSIVIVLVERLLDLAIVVFLVLTLGTIFDYLNLIDGMEMSSRILIGILTVVMAYVLTYTLRFWHEILTKNNFVALSVVAIVIENILYIINVVAHLFRKNGLKLLVFTIAIWMLEAAAFASVYIYFNIEISLLMFLGLLSFLAFALPAGPVGYGAIHLIFYYALQSNLLEMDVMDDGLYYSSFVYIPALLFFGIFWLIARTISRG